MGPQRTRAENLLPARARKNACRARSYERPDVTASSPLLILEAALGAVKPRFTIESQRSGARLPHFKYARTISIKSSVTSREGFPPAM